MLSKCVDKYTSIRKTYFAQPEQLAELMSGKLENIVNEMFRLSLTQPRDYKITAGIAIESRRLDIVEEITNKTENLSSTLDNLFDLSQRSIQNKKFREELITLIKNVYEARQISSALVDHINICMCYFHLGKYKEAAEILLKLITGTETQEFICACQVATDLYEADDHYFLRSVSDVLESKQIEDQAILDKRTKLVGILKGSFHEGISLKFLSQNNRSNKDVMHQIRLTWDGKSSVIYSAIVNCYAIMHMGTLDHTYLIDASNKAWVAKCSHWGKFSSVSCLGSIHKNNDSVGGILNEWGKLGTDDEYAKGGRAYATGLALAGSKNLEKTGLMWEDIKSGKEPQIHGGLLGIGLLNYASADLSLVEEMKGLLFAESATQGEAAGYGIGLIMTGHLDDNLLAELIQ
jgi:26S proteasome regulatory subunit N2